MSLVRPASIVGTIRRKFAKEIPITARTLSYSTRYSEPITTRIDPHPQTLASRDRLQRDFSRNWHNLSRRVVFVKSLVCLQKTNGVALPSRSRLVSDLFELNDHSIQHAAHESLSRRSQIVAHTVWRIINWPRFQPTSKFQMPCTSASWVYICKPKVAALIEKEESGNGPPSDP